jgi:penicillin-binding protein 1A
VPFSPAYEGGGSQLTLRRAFATSSNIVATRLAYSLGYDTVAAQAALLGFRPPPPRVSSFPLVANSRAIDLAAAYAAFSNGGHRVPPRFFEMPGAPDPLAAPPVISPRALAYMTDIGLAVVEEPGATAHRNAPVPGLRFAGKTGTTNNQADAWFIAFGENFVVAAWVGYDRPRPGHNNGGDLPAQIVHSFLAEQHLGWGQPSQTWPPPSPDGDTLGAENNNAQGVAQVAAPDGVNYCQ